MKVKPYLFFDGRCEEAFEFYKGALGATIDCVMRFKESPDQSMVPPGLGEKVMHGQISIGGEELWASDGQACVGKKAVFEGVSITISVPDVATAERFFSALSEGGKVQMPMAKTFYSPAFGMVADKFGVPWMIIADQ